MEDNKILAVGLMEITVSNNLVYLLMNSTDEIKAEGSKIGGTEVFFSLKSMYLLKLDLLDTSLVPMWIIMHSAFVNTGEWSEKYCSNELVVNPGRGIIVVSSMNLRCLPTESVMMMFLSGIKGQDVIFHRFGNQTLWIEINV